MLVNANLASYVYASLVCAEVYNLAVVAERNRISRACTVYGLGNLILSVVGIGELGL